MLHGDKKNIVFVIGRVAAGKTSHIRGLVDVDDRLVGVYPGQACREKFGADKMAESSNPTAPKETEAFVREYICDAIDRLEPGMTAFVDGFPRTPNQVQWLYKNFVYNKGVACIFLVYTCDDTVRRARAFQRDAGTKAESLMNARMITDDQNQLRVLEELMMRNAHAASTDARMVVPVTVIDNTEEIPAIAGLPPFELTTYKSIDGRVARAMEDLYDEPDHAGISFDDRNLATMMACNAELSDQTLSPLNLTMEKLRREAVQYNEMPLMAGPVDWTRRFVARAIEELQELLKELPETWWSKELADVRKARVELIDAWHFMMSASQALGMDATFFARTYYAKLKVNLQRQADGYVKRNKKEGDDNHVGAVNERPRT